jgi:hypothetical protein
MRRRKKKEDIFLFKTNDGACKPRFKTLKNKSSVEHDVGNNLD